MSRIVIPKIRPASWKIFAPGQRGVEHVRRVLEQAGVDTTEPSQEPTISDPPLFATVATPRAEVSLTEEELVALLDRDDRLKVSLPES